MCKKLFKYTLIALFLSNFSYAQHFSDKILTGAEQVDLYLPELEGKRVGVVTNQTGIVTYTRPIDVLHEKQMEMFTESIIDFLLYYNIQITKIFSPEHGFRGDADAGETVKSGKDVKT